MKITLGGVLRLLKTLLGFIPDAPHVNLQGVTFVAAANNYSAQTPTGLQPISAFAVNVDAGILAALEPAQLKELSQYVDPANTVVLLVSGDSASRIRTVTGLPD